MKGQAWTQEQIAFIEEHYPAERAEDVAKAIGRTKIAVQKKAFAMGIKKDNELFFNVRSKAHSGENSGTFKGYRRTSSKGYICKYIPEHPYSDKKGNVMEHRLVVEKALGFYLPKEFDVHHINGKKDDNRLENLAIMTHSAHSALHNKIDRKQKRGSDNPTYKTIDIEKAKEMRREGFKAKAICEYFGIGKTKLYKELRDAM